MFRWSGGVRVNGLRWIVYRMCWVRFHWCLL
uniref:Uncharacterized protein n=1 Tax=Siphoviridae sp. ctkV91 TaxID=2827924 RepID=A0A8S5TE91_9CAUD|nr:MAG TPA: hypothetical protein [Siphoviridae sp. ctkV91]